MEYFVVNKIKIVVTQNVDSSGISLPHFLRMNQAAGRYSYLCSIIGNTNNSKFT